MVEHTCAIGTFDFPVAPKIGGDRRANSAEGAKNGFREDSCVVPAACRFLLRDRRVVHPLRVDNLLFRLPFVQRIRTHWARGDVAACPFFFISARVPHSASRRCGARDRSTRPRPADDSHPSAHSPRPPCCLCHLCVRISPPHTHTIIHPALARSARNFGSFLRVDVTRYHSFPPLYGR